MLHACTRTLSTACNAELCLQRLLLHSVKSNCCWLCLRVYASIFFNSTCCCSLFTATDVINTSCGCTPFIVLAAGLHLERLLLDFVKSGCCSPLRTMPTAGLCLQNLLLNSVYSACWWAASTALVLFTAPAVGLSFTTYSTYRRILCTVTAVM